LAALAVPVLAILVAPQDETAELQELAAWPSVTSEAGTLNVNYLSEAGAWLDDHFAYRQQLITANAKLKARLLQTSAVNQVVVGSDGWLYYAATLPDYQRTTGFTAQTYRNMAKNLALAQEYVEGLGATFIAVVAPDKSNAAGQNMPYYLLEGEGASVASEVTSAFEAAGVGTVALLEHLAGNPQWYFKTDSHWNTQGALEAYQLMVAALGEEPVSYAGAAVTYNTAFTGDIEAMLYPLDRTPESEAVYAGSDAYVMTAGISVEDALITTASTRAGATGSLYMYRDSFGNSLLPFFATQFASATFSKYVPYDLTQVAATGATHVVVERAERHASFFAASPAIMPALAREVPASVTAATGTQAALTVAEDGGYYVVTGSIPGAPTGECRVLLAVPSARKNAEVASAAAGTAGASEGGAAAGGCWEAALVSTFDEDDVLLSDNGFLLYLPKTWVDSFDGATLYVEADGVVMAYATVVRES
jgi:hypothetical protein